MKWSQGMGMWSAAEQLDSLCVALSPVPCKGKKVFWNWLLAFSNAVRHWGEVLAAGVGAVTCFYFYCDYNDLALLFLPSCTSTPHPQDSYSPLLTRSWSHRCGLINEWEMKWMPTSQPLLALTQSTAVWFPTLWSALCHSKEKYFLSFGYPDFQTSPVSWQIHNGLGLSVNDTNVWWVTSITSYRLWNQLTFALSLKMEGMRQSCRHTPFTLLIMPTSIFCLWGYLIVVSVKNYPSFH